MNSIYLSAKSISKKFNNKYIFKDISFSLSIGESILISGSNGSGKTTLLKIIAGLDKSYYGKLIISDDKKNITADKIPTLVSYVSPITQLYEELTPAEHIKFFCGYQEIPEQYLFLLNTEKQNFAYKKTSELSTGMKQRVKILMAILLNRTIWVFDEITLGLDKKGKKYIYDLIDRFRDEKLLIFATNEKSEYKICEKAITLD